MKIKLLTICLLLFTSQVSAKWLFLSVHPDGVEYYYDSEKIKKQGRYVDFWLLVSLPRKSEHGDLSMKQNLRVDCKKFRMKTLSDFYYAKKMGRGKINSSSKVPDKKWYKVPANSFIATAIGKVCN